MKVVCFDIGGTNVKYGLLDGDGNILDKNKFKTNINNGQDILYNMCDVVKNYIALYHIDGISISSPGFVDTEKGIITDGTILEGFIGLNIRDYFESRFNIKTAVDNDANCATIAEHKIGNGKECKNLVCITIGTGIGGGIVINNEIYNGSKFMAGEFGFMFIDGLGKDDPGEKTYSNLASTRGLVERVSKKLNEDISGEEIFKRASESDNACLEEIEFFYDKLAMGIYNLAYILNPDKILLGGAISTQEVITDEVKLRLDKYTSVSKSLNEYVEIDRCKFLNDAGLIGALCNFVNKYDS